MATVGHCIYLGGGGTLRSQSNMNTVLLVTLAAFALGEVHADGEHPSPCSGGGNGTCACSTTPCFRRGLGLCDTCSEHCAAAYCCCEQDKLQFGCKRNKDECSCQEQRCDELGAPFCHRKNLRSDCSGCRKKPEFCCCGVKNPCDRQCPFPLEMNHECTECECPYFLTQGRVYSGVGGHPIANASLTTAPSKGSFPRSMQYATSLSDETGQFKVCVGRGNILTVTKQGYEDKAVTVRTTDVDVVMDRAYIYVKRHPASMERELGDSVTFCCEAEGLPNTMEYTWYKVEKQGEYKRKGSGESLTLRELESEDSGQYVCVARSEAAGSAVSSQATLTIHSPGYLDCSTCSREIPLRSGCSWNGMPYYMEASCNSKCRAVGRRGEEEEEEECASAPTLREMCVSQYQTLQISCRRGQVQEVRAAVKCQCERVSIPYPYVYGYVTSDTDKRPLHNVAISVHGKHIATTNSEGFFNMTLASLQTRIPIKFEAGAGYNELIHVVNIPEDYSGGVGLMVSIPEVLEIRVQRQSRVSIPLFNEGDVEMEFPDDVFLNENYEKADEVVLQLTVTSTQQEPSSTVPGDFMTLRNNMPRALVSEGLFSMRFRDPSGNNVLMKRGCKLSIRPEVLMQGLPSPLRLWGLNERTGYWEVSTDLEVAENGRLEGLMQVLPDVRTYNLDYVMDVCYMRITAYDSSAFDHNEKLAGVTFKLVTRFQDSERWASVVTATSSAAGGACVAVPCCQGRRCQEIVLYTSITATIMTAASPDETIALNPANPDEAHDTGLADYLLEELDYSVTGRSIDSRIISRTDGPTYPSSGQCLTSKGLHYRFYKDVDVLSDNAGPPLR